MLLADCSLLSCRSLKVLLQGYAVDQITDFIAKDKTRRYMLRVSYLEIYMERILDLLNPGDELKVRQDKNGFYVDCKEVVVTVRCSPNVGICAQQIL